MDLEVHGFAGYELLDTGDGRKLERFGEVVLDRPAAGAIWPRTDPGLWDSAHGKFLRHEGGSGEWKTRSRGVPEAWPAVIDDLTMEIRLTGFGNVGLFPEHTCHFGWMADKLEAPGGPNVLNLFGYTGGATMACAKAGARVTHVDAAKSVNGWAILNAESNGLQGAKIRFLADDATKFVRRELRRGNRYEGIILDPPSFGRGTKGEVWKLEEHFFELLGLCSQLLADDPAFLLVTSHSPGVTPSVLRHMLGELGGTLEDGEMLIRGPKTVLPAGVYARWSPKTVDSQPKV